MARKYDGPALDISWQDITERPYKGRGETVAGTTDDELGEIQTTGVPDILIDDGDVGWAKAIKELRALSHDTLMEIGREMDGETATAAIYVLLEREGVAGEVLDWVHGRDTPPTADEMSAFMDALLG